MKQQERIVRPEIRPVELGQRDDPRFAELRPSQLEERRASLPAGVSHLERPGGGDPRPTEQEADDAKSYAKARHLDRQG